MLFYYIFSQSSILVKLLDNNIIIHLAFRKSKINGVKLFNS